MSETRDPTDGTDARTKHVFLSDPALTRLTDEGSQELVVTGGPWPEDEAEGDTMIINMGPQHPSTHGVLRLMLELDAETIVRAKPVIGYLHTGMEKTGEELTYVQGATNVTRMDYASPLSNELVFSMAVEQLLDIEVPPRATWIRMYLNELNRMASHLLFQATNGLDMGALSMIVYGWREREETLRLLEKITGLRMNNNYIRPGGVAAELPDGWQEDTLALCETVEKGVSEYDELLTGNPIWQERLVGVGVITTEQALALSATGPILRSTGFPWDLRKSQPYLAYDEVDFDVPVYPEGDVYARYRVRMDEMRQSTRIVDQCLDRLEEMEGAPWIADDRKVVLPPREELHTSMESLIHHFKIVTEGYRVAEGEVYVTIESPRGELGCYVISDGGPKPWRVKFRAPSFVATPAAATMSRNALVADLIAIVGSLDGVMGEVDR
jgi:NADH-quinone oxidoreductase subunit D